MPYITQTPNSSGAYPASQSNPAPGLIPLTDEQAAMVVDYNGFVTIASYEEEYEDGFYRTAYEVTPNTEAWEKWKEEIAPDEQEELKNAKTKKILQSKTDLATFLTQNPLTWTDGNQYSVTSEKQQQLTSKIAVAQMAQQAGQPYTLTWNTTGDVCQEWTLENLVALAFAIDAYVTPLVSYQQEKEVEIKNCEIVEDVNAIEIDYSSVGG